LKQDEGIPYPEQAEICLVKKQKKLICYRIKAMKMKTHKNYKKENKRPNIL